MPAKAKLTDEQVRRIGRRVRAGERQTVLADSDRGILVRAFAVGPLASEWIGATVIAIKARVPIAMLRDGPMQFPTFGEALSYAVDDSNSLRLVQRARPDAALVTDDYLRADADDPLPGDDGVAVHLRLSRPAAAVSADAVALEDAELAGGQAGHPQASSDELSAHVVDSA